MKTFLLKISLFLLSILLLTSSLSAQEKDSIDYKKHVLKAGVNISLDDHFESGILYERHFLNKSTFSYGFFFGSIAISDNEIFNPYYYISGNTSKLVFQYRYYVFQTMDASPGGFYVGGITNFQYYYAEGSILYSTANNSTEIKSETIIDSGYLGIGPLMGYQFILFNKLSLDINTYFHYNQNVYHLEEKDGIQTPFTLGGMLTLGYAFGSG